MTSALGTPITKDFIDTVTAQRQKGVPDAEIAQSLGIARRLLHDRIVRWNRKNPANPAPRPLAQQQGPLYARVAALAKEGKTTQQVMDLTGRKRNSVLVAMSVARRKGLLPPTGRRAAGGDRTYRHYRNKGAAPPRGTVGALLDGLTRDEVETLLRSARPKEPTLAHTISRLLKERLNDPR